MTGSDSGWVKQKADIRNLLNNTHIKKGRPEVKKVSIYEYDQEEHIRMEREEARVALLAGMNENFKIIHLTGS